MSKPKQYAIRNIDGRLIESVKTFEEARSRTVGAGFIEVQAEPSLDTTVELEGKLSVAGLEFALNLDPATCEREFMVELRQKLDGRYPGGDAV